MSHEASEPRGDPQLTLHKWWGFRYQLAGPPSILRGLKVEVGDPGCTIGYIVFDMWEEVYESTYSPTLTGLFCNAATAREEPPVPTNRRICVGGKPETHSHSREMTSEYKATRHPLFLQLQSSRLGNPEPHHEANIWRDSWPNSRQTPRRLPGENSVSDLRNSTASLKSHLERVLGLILNYSQLNIILSYINICFIKTTPPAQ